MQIFKQNFLTESQELIRLLPDAAYVSLHIETTGKTAPGQPSLPRDLSPSQLYDSLRKGPERYSIFQVGICVFTENPEFRRFFESEDYPYRNVSGNVENALMGLFLRGQRQDQEIRRRRGHLARLIQRFRDRVDANGLRINAQRFEQLLQLVRGDNNGNGNDNNEANAEVREGPNPNNGQDGDQLIMGLLRDLARENNIQDILQGLEPQDNDVGADHAQNQNNRGDASDTDDENDDNNHDNIGQANVDGDENDAGEGDDNNDADEDNDDDIELEPPPEFVVNQYTFHLFPSDIHDYSAREMILNPATIAQVLNNIPVPSTDPHNVQDSDSPALTVDNWMRRGVPYQLVRDSEQALIRYQDKEIRKEIKQKCDGEKRYDINGEDADMERRKCNPRLPTKPEDNAFFCRTLNRVREWLDQPVRLTRDRPNSPEGSPHKDEEAEGMAFLLPQCDSSMRQVLIEQIRSQYPSLIIERAEAPYQNLIYLVRVEPGERKAREEKWKKIGWKRLHTDQIGFTRVFKALSDACRGELGETELLNKECDNFVRNVKVLSRKRANGEDIDEELSHFKNGERNEEPPHLTNKVKGGRKVPIIVHNGLMNFLFLLTHFHDPELPSTYCEAKQLINHYFPEIYDTKVLASECSDDEIKHDCTSLRYLFDAHCGRNNDGVSVQVVNRVSTRGVRDLSHGAGSEAFMTGAIFQSLSRRLMKHLEQHSRLTIFESRKKERARRNSVGSLTFLDPDLTEYESSAAIAGRNRVFGMQSMYTIDMSSKIDDDPFSQPVGASSIFRVKLMDSSVDTRDINRALMHLTDENGEKVDYDIIWIDNQTFMVKTLCRDIPRVDLILYPRMNEEKLNFLKKNGALIRSALETRFPSKSILTLQEYQSRQKNNPSETSFLSGLFSFFVYNGDKRNEADQFDHSVGEQRSRKRRRTD